MTLVYDSCACKIREVAARNGRHRRLDMDFMDEWREFFRLMGTRAFWELPDHQRHGALDGLWHAGIKADADNQLLLTASGEYARREALIFGRLR